MIDDYDESSGWMFLLVPAHPGFPGQIPQSRKTVVLCVCACVIDDASCQISRRFMKFCRQRKPWLNKKRINKQ